KRPCAIPLEVSQKRACQSSVEVVGGISIRGGSWASHTRRAEPLECGQGFVLGTAASRTCSRSRLRSHARKPLSSHRSVSKMAKGQKSERLHLRSTRGNSAAGVGGD